MTARVRTLRPVGAAEVNDADAVVVARQALEAAHAALGPVRGGPLAQPFVELLAVDHADEAALDGDVDLDRLGRDHARGRGAGDEEVVGDGEVLDGTRRNRAATGLDPPGAVQQQHAAALAREVIGCRGTRRPAAHHDRVEIDDGCLTHGALLSRPRNIGACRVERGSTCAANHAATMKRPALMKKTMP